MKWIFSGLRSHCQSVCLPKASGSGLECPEGVRAGNCSPHVWAVFQVEPFASLSEAVRSSVPRLLMNREVVGPLAWCPRSRDVVQLGDLVHSVERLVELLGWTEEMKDLVRRETGKVQTAEQDPLRGRPPHCPRAW